MVTNVCIDIIFVMEGIIALMVVMNGIGTAQVQPVHQFNLRQQQHGLFVNIGNSDVIMVTNVCIDIIFVMEGIIALMVVMNGIGTAQVQPVHQFNLRQQQHGLFVNIGNSDVIMVTNVCIDIIFVMEGIIALMVVMNGIGTAQVQAVHQFNLRQQLRNVSERLHLLIVGSSPLPQCF
ncbi:Hypothetical predicted protein [Paramuricea clavata]|uniref:Uncharacterized protein n=1 Tax=Paramuricea clavata TaxID=317549 RepID=A0A6S7IS55_PARCT|nr:Hypothetical predicted protein [Paramuricea clavata]